MFDELFAAGGCFCFFDVLDGVVFESEGGYVLCVVYAGFVFLEGVGDGDFAELRDERLFVVFAPDVFEF